MNTRFEGVNPYLYVNEKESVIMLVNSTLENFEKTEFFIKGVTFDKAISIDKDGMEREVYFERIDDRISIKLPLAYMSTVTLKLVKE